MVFGQQLNPCVSLKQVQMLENKQWPLRETLQRLGFKIDGTTADQTSPKKQQQPEQLNISDKKIRHT